MNRATKLTIEVMWRHVEDACENRSRAHWAHWQLAFDSELEAERQHRRAFHLVRQHGRDPYGGIYAQSKPPSADTMARYFTVRWCIEGYDGIGKRGFEAHQLGLLTRNAGDDRRRHNMPAMTCDAIVSQKIGCTLAMAIGADLRASGINLIDFSTEERSIITAVDYAAEMSPQLARARAL